MRWLVFLTAVAVVVAVPNFRPAAATPEWAGYGDPSPDEQQFMELLNAARTDPTALQKRLGDLTDGGRLDVKPRQPLVLNARLSAACRAHSQDMNDRKYFNHFDPEGKSGGDRLTKAGYDWQNYRESITAVYEHPGDALDRLLIDEGTPDLGHRLSLLSLKPEYEAFREAGMGIVSGDGPYKRYYTNVLATDGKAGPFLLGVVYKDADGNGAYDPGEGVKGVSIKVDPGNAETKTASAGGYGIPLKAGQYTVIASGEGIEGQLRSAVTLGPNNVKADFVVKKVGRASAPAGERQPDRNEHGAVEQPGVDGKRRRQPGDVQPGAREDHQSAGHPQEGRGQSGQSRILQCLPAGLSSANRRRRSPCRRRTDDRHQLVPLVEDPEVRAHPPVDEPDDGLGEPLVVVADHTALVDEAAGHRFEAQAFDLVHVR
jgi:uncharacterized protein YkwD